MRSSPDQKPRKSEAHLKDKVLLPSFIDMMRAMGDGMVSDADAAETEGDFVKAEEQRQKSALQLEMEAEVKKTQELCASMRKEALAEIDKLLEQARQEADALRDKARREVTVKLEEQARVESENAQAVLHKAVKAFEDEKAELYATIEPQLLDLTMYVCESILQYELVRDENAYISIIKNALTIVRSDGRERTLRLPPKAFDRLIGEEEDSDFARQLHDLGVSIVRDANVAEGDCLVESPIGGVRAGIATQLSRIRYAAAKENE
ncbi:hypothetical protein LJC27_02120 [Christensenellaceae bacterium OttesenSCG-928-M15]|nr:hypothetical protein [Christensenellaceae bacterium OttesenSCG-928-M15]